MPRGSFHRLSEPRRAQILESAAQEFSAHGYAGASLNHILAAAGVSKGAAYYYFDDKADLFVTVARHYLDHVCDHTRLDPALLDAESFWPSIAGFYREFRVHGEEAPWLVGLAKAAWRLAVDARGARTLGPLLAWARNLVEGLLARGQELGLIRDDLPRELLIEILLSIDGSMDQWLVDRIDRLGAEEISALGERLLSMVRVMLSPERRAS